MKKVSFNSNFIGNFPKCYHHFPRSNTTKEVLVIELLGKPIQQLWNEHNHKLSDVTIYKIALQVVSGNF